MGSFQRAFLLTILALLGGCRPAGLVSADGELRADRSQIEFGEVWREGTGRQSVQLSNTGKASLLLKLEAAAPFGAPAELTLSGGERVALELTFEPTALGAATGLLTVQAPNAKLTLGLAGTAIEPPACDSTICRDAKLDAVTLACVLSAKPDGTGCTDGCLEGACKAGTCLGTVRTCEDDDPCTTDGCAPGRGCVHTPKACVPINPCSAGSCSAGAGCVETPVADGISCGAGDCTSALVCVSGQCVSRAVPDGAACGAQTLCQTRGRCLAQQCVQDARSALAPAWTWPASAGHQLVGLVADPQGNTFTADCRSAGTFRSQCELVSFTPNGTERWRVAYPHLTYTGAGALRDSLMLAGPRVFSTIGPDWVDAFDATTGAHAWSVDTITTFPGTRPEWVRMIAIAFDGVDEVVLALEGNSAGGIGASRVVGLSSTTGAVLHSMTLPAQGFSLVVDRATNLYVGHISGPPSARVDTVTALDSSWAVQWQRTTPVIASRIHTLRATHRDRLLITHPSDTQLWSTVGGALVSSSLPTSVSDPQIVWGDPALFATQQFCPTASCQSFFDFRIAVVAVDNQSLAVSRLELPKLSWFSGLWLTQRESTLITFHPFATPAELWEIDARGNARMQCLLGLDGRRNPRAGPVLTAGRYAMVTGLDSDGYEPRLEVWDLPGYAPAANGWASQRGGPGLDSRAR